MKNSVQTQTHNPFIEINVTIITLCFAQEQGLRWNLRYLDLFWPDDPSSSEEVVLPSLITYIGSNVGCLLVQKRFRTNK